MTLVRAKPQCPADILHAVLIGHQRDDRVRRVRIEFDTVRVIVSDHIPDKLHDGKLHAKAEAQERDIVFTRVSDRVDHPLDPSVAKTAGDKDAVDVFERFRDIVRIDVLRVHPFDVDRGVLRDAAVL